MLKKFSEILPLITGSLAVVVTAVTLLINSKTAKLQEDITKLSTTAKQQEISQKDIQFIRDFKFKMYDEVAASIESNNPRKQRAAVALISALLSDSNETDADYRNALLNVFLNSDSVNTALKEKIGSNLDNEQKFIQDQRSTDSIANTRKASAQSSTPKNLRWDVDIFYSENTMPKSLANANSTKAVLDALYNTRVRILSSLTNARPGYNIVGNEIRYNDNANELEQATKIQKMLEEKGYKCNLKISGMETPWYLSVFIQ